MPLPAPVITAIFPDVAIPCFSFRGAPAASFRDGSPEGNCDLAAAGPHHGNAALSETRMAEPSNRPTEPEIIPPGTPLPGGSRVWVASGQAGEHHVYVRPIGPLGMALLTVAVGAVAALAIVVLLGAAVFGLAAIGVLTIAGIVAGLLRGPRRPLR